MYVVTANSGLPSYHLSALYWLRKIQRIFRHILNSKKTFHSLSLKINKWKLCYFANRNLFILYPRLCGNPKLNFFYPSITINWKYGSISDESIFPRLILRRIEPCYHDSIRSERSIRRPYNNVKIILFSMNWPSKFLFQLWNYLRS